MSDLLVFFGGAFLILSAISIVSYVLERLARRFGIKLGDDDGR